MSQSQLGKQVAKTSLLYVGLALALVVALPLLAGLAYAVRLLIPVLLAATLVALAFSPALRRWFSKQADDALEYKGLALPAAGLQGHPAHSWAKVEAGTARVGIDALALAVLGKIGAIEAPSVGSTVAQGQTLFTLLRGERRLQVKAPIGGLVVGINSEAVQDPAVLARSPYGSGWVVRLRDVRPGREPTPLHGGTSLRRWFRDDVDRLLAILAPAGQATSMTDGGRLAPDLADRIDESQWAEIAARLFANPRA
jgi:glycine cleavage system H protein